MNALRILLLAPETNPESHSTALIGYLHGEALARLHEVTLVVRGPQEGPVRRVGGPFHAIEGIRLPSLDRLYAWAIRRIFKFDWGRQSLTAASYPVQVVFECLAWRRLQSRIKAGDFDIVLRIMPIVSVLPSPFAFFLRNGPIPFVIGPLNGGLPWPKGFPQLDKQRKQAGYWVSNLRGLYRYLPFARSTYGKAAAIIAGSSHTYSEFSTYREKLFFVPGENGVQPDLFRERHRSWALREKVELIFAGRLIPLKACDLALRAAAPLLRQGVARFTVVGDGPERQSLQKLTETLQVATEVSFLGMLSYPDTLKELQRADVMVFPSLREFGGTVVFEALSLGAVPVVADFGGPGDIVTPEVGYKIPLTNADDMVLKLEAVLRRLVDDRAHLEALRQQGMKYARGQLTFDAKARAVTDVLLWTLGRAAKPKLQPPERLVPIAGQRLAARRNRTTSNAHCQRWKKPLEAHMKTMIGKVQRLFEMYSHFRSPFLTLFVRLGILKLAYCSYDVRKDNHNYRLLGRPLAGDHRMLREVLVDESYARILEALPSKALRVLDIGAHIGSFTVWLHDHATIGEAYCFEPNPESFNLCRFNLAHFTNTEVIMAAVAGVSRQAEILIDPAAQERSSILKDIGRPSNVQSVPVTVLSLANWLSDHPGDFDVVKMDCEGAEWEILKMCPEAFSRFSTLVAEIHHDPKDQKTKADFSVAMQELGFEVISNDHLFFGVRIRKGGKATAHLTQATATNVS